MRYVNSDDSPSLIIVGDKAASTRTRVVAVLAGAAVLALAAAQSCGKSKENHQDSAEVVPQSAPVTGTDK